jgi:uncharacterized protein YciI
MDYSAAQLIFLKKFETMHSLFTALLLLLMSPLVAQVQFPDFLSGTWKVEGRDNYEHWDQLNAHNMKGFSYSLKDGKMVVSEYLELQQNSNEVIYSASVLQQNGGSRIDFTLTRSDSIFQFENPHHDFPKKITYQRMTPDELYVQVSDGSQSGFSYTLKKQLEGLPKKDTTLSNPNYDPIMANRLGGDDYGMKNYILVLLKTGPNPSTDNAWIQECFRGHLNNIERLVEQGKLIVAGPLGTNEHHYRGIFILDNVSTPEAARELLQTDPAIRDGLLDAELFIWYGSAALPLYLTPADAIWRKKP